MRQFSQKTCSCTNPCENQTGSVLQPARMSCFMSGYPKLTSCALKCRQNGLGQLTARSYGQTKQTNSQSLSRGSLACKFLKPCYALPFQKSLESSLIPGYFDVHRPAPSCQSSSFPGVEALRQAGWILQYGCRGKRTPGSVSSWRTFFLTQTSSVLILGVLAELYDLDILPLAF